MFLQSSSGRIIAGGNCLNLYHDFQYESLLDMRVRDLRQTIGLAETY